MSPQDSVALAGRLGGPISASVLDAGTVEHRVRFGVSLNYIGPRFETNATVEQTVRGDAGVQGGVPAATVFRIVMRVTRQLF